MGCILYGDEKPVAPLIIGVVIEISFTASLGKELVWRNFLISRLESLGSWRTGLVSGISCGIRHLPFIFFASGYHRDGDRLIVIFGLL